VTPLLGLLALVALIPIVGTALVLAIRETARVGHASQEEASQ